MSETESLFGSYEEYIYKYINDIVGHVGPSTFQAYSATGEVYITYMWRFDSSNPKEFALLSSGLSDVIRDYMKHSKNIKHSGLAHDSEAEPVVYWRLKPEIKAWEKMVGDQVRADKKYKSLYLRLLISTKPTLSKPNLTSRGIELQDI